MINRFEGESGQRLLLDAFLSQRIVVGNQLLAQALVSVSAIVPVSGGQRIIEQGASDNDIYFILSGSVEVVVNGRIVGRRHAGDCIGEMASIEVTQQRSATVIASDVGVLARVSEESFSKLGHQFPDLWRQIAKVLARRLIERNSLIGRARDRIRLFIISSAESLPIARAIQNAFEHDAFTTTVWTDGVFRATNYTLQSLEDEVDQSDFAVAIAHADDVTESRSQSWPAPRDNVIFELGLFMGRLGRARAILMEPREEKLKLPSDLAGITTISYRFEKGKDAAARIGPACNALREHILKLGPNI